MRFFLSISIIVIILAVAKIDLTEGTIPSTAYSKSNECNEQLAVKYVSVIAKEGDTVHRLLAEHPTDERVSVPERTAHFYQLNPHLKKQAIAPGELVRIPVYTNNGACKK